MKLSVKAILLLGVQKALIATEGADLGPVGYYGNKTVTSDGCDWDKNWINSKFKVDVTNCVGEFRIGLVELSAVLNVPDESQVTSIRFGFDGEKIVGGLNSKGKIIAPGVTNVIVAPKATLKDGCMQLAENATITKATGGTYDETGLTVYRGDEGECDENDDEGWDKVALYCASLKTTKFFGVGCSSPDVQLTLCAVEVQGCTSLEVKSVTTATLSVQGATSLDIKGSVVNGGTKVIVHDDKLKTLKFGSVLNSGQIEVKEGVTSVKGGSVFNGGSVKLADCSSIDVDAVYGGGRITCGGSNLKTIKFNTVREEGVIEACDATGVSVNGGTVTALGGVLLGPGAKVDVDKIDSGGFVLSSENCPNNSANHRSLVASAFGIFSAGVALLVF